MVIFHCYVSSPEGISINDGCEIEGCRKSQDIWDLTALTDLSRNGNHAAMETIMATYLILGNYSIFRQTHIVYI